ncbi:MAG: hypothetical protein ACPGQT_03035 [Rhodothermales bacterium]
MRPSQRIQSMVAALAALICLSACEPSATTTLSQTAAPEPAEESTSSAEGLAMSEEEAKSSDPLELSWTMDTNDGTYGMPETVIYLNADGYRFPIASGPGMRDMSEEQRERFKAPEGALAAAGYWAGFSVKLLVIQEAGQIAIQQAIWDEGAPTEQAHDYEEVARIAAADIAALKNGTGLMVNWSGCFAGQHDTSTSTFDVLVEQNQITTDVYILIADEQNAYYTSAQIVGAGVQVGATLFVEQYITIEDDNQNNVAIWHLDDASDPQTLTNGDQSFDRCSTE